MKYDAHGSEVREAMRRNLIHGIRATADSLEFTERDAIDNIQEAASLELNVILPFDVHGRTVHYLVIDSDMYSVGRDVLLARIVHEVRQIVREYRGSGKRPAIDLNSAFFAPGVIGKAIPWLFDLYHEVDWIDCGEVL